MVSGEQGKALFCIRDENANSKRGFSRPVGTDFPGLNKYLPICILESVQDFNLKLYRVSGYAFFFFLNLALTDRNIQARSSLRVVWES